MYDVDVIELISTPLGTISLLVLIVIQLLSFSVAGLVSYEFYKLVYSRAAFFAAMDLSGKSYRVRSKFFLLVSYIVTIVIATLAFDFLFIFRPHFL